MNIAGRGLFDLAMGDDSVEAEAAAFLIMECVRVLTGTWGKR